MGVVDANNQVEYLNGDIHLPIWAPRNTTESRLLIEKRMLAAGLLLRVDGGVSMGVQGRLFLEPRRLHAVLGPALLLRVVCDRVPRRGGFGVCGMPSTCRRVPVCLGGRVRLCLLAGQLSVRVWVLSVLAADLRCWISARCMQPDVRFALRGLRGAPGRPGCLDPRL